MSKLDFAQQILDRANTMGAVREKHSQPENIAIFRQTVLNWLYCDSSKPSLKIDGPVLSLGEPDDDLYLANVLRASALAVFARAVVDESVCIQLDEEYGLPSAHTGRLWHCSIPLVRGIGLMICEILNVARHGMEEETSPVMERAIEELDEAKARTAEDLYAAYQTAFRFLQEAKNTILDVAEKVLAGKGTFYPDSAAPIPANIRSRPRIKCDAHGRLQGIQGYLYKVGWGRECPVGCKGAWDSTDIALGVLAKFVQIKFRIKKSGYLAGMYDTIEGYVPWLANIQPEPTEHPMAAALREWTGFFNIDLLELETEEDEDEDQLI